MSDKDDKSGKNPGAVHHDARGNAVWQWAVDAGKQALDSTSRLLKRLEVPGLKLEGDTAENQRPDAASKSAGGAAGAKRAGASAKPDWEVGYNLYGGAGGAPGGRAAKPVGRPVAAKPAAVMKPAAETPSRPSLWQRLFRQR